MRGYICITLKSDLCAASGDGFSLSIDTDICADRYGLPFIPSRRLKGCLREAAVYIGCDHIDSIFGVSGDVVSGSLRVNDARLEGYESLKAQAEQSGYSAEKVLGLFTSVKASTAIENDTAKENSLRFTRVVNHYTPFDKSEMVFVSEIEYAEGDEEHIKNYCAALRNIGYKRTRGYGSVRCLFEPANEVQPLTADIPDDDGEYELSLTVRLNSPAMFAGKNSNETLDYIPGSAVLGAFAAGYLNGGGDSDDFDRLFLSGAVSFPNMYITDGKTVSAPAPAVLGKAKDSKEIWYIFSEDNDTSKPLPKAFKGGYLIEDKESTPEKPKAKELKPEKEVIYHNGKKQGEDSEKKQKKDSKLLYTQECLSEGQLFSGAIRGTGKDLNRLFSVIKCGKINLGRSKSAQYSSCDIVRAKCVPVNTESVSSGKVYALLCSDVILTDENAAFSTDIFVLAKALGAAPDDIDAAHSSLKYTTVMGYISVGRYKRSHIRAFEKGSVLCFESKTELPRYMTIGERQNEGFGVVKLYTKDDLMTLGKALPDSDRTEDNAANDSRLLDLVKRNNAREELRLKALDYADEQYNKISSIFTASFVGRLLLMVGQAADKADLDKRVASVKTDNKRETAQEFVTKAEPLFGNEWREFLKISLSVIKYRMKEAGNNE